MSDGRIFYTAIIDRSYQDRDGNWQHAQSYSLSDLPTLTKVTDAVIHRIVELEQADKAKAKAAELEPAA